MPKFRKKSPEILARRFETNNDNGSHIRSLVSWANSQQAWTAASHDDTTVWVHGDRMGPKGEAIVHRLDVGDWIVRAENGMWGICKAKDFDGEYDEVSA